MVHPTNESLNEPSPLTEKIHQLAGPELKQEVKTKVKGRLVGSLDPGAHSDIIVYTCVNKTCVKRGPFFAVERVVQHVFVFRGLIKNIDFQEKGI